MNQKPHPGLKNRNTPPTANTPILKLPGAKLLEDRQQRRGCAGWPHPHREDQRANSARLAIGSTAARHTTICVAAPAPIVPQAKDGKLRALAVAYKKRLQALGDVPTMAEAGYPDIEFDNWFGVFVPAGTHNREIAKSMALPDLEEHLVALGFEPVGSSTEEFAKQIKIELEKWVKVIQATHIKAQ